MVYIWKIIGSILIFWGFSQDLFAQSTELTASSIKKKQLKNLDVVSSIELGGLGYDEGQDSSQIAMLNIRPVAQLKINSQLGVRADVEFNLNSARSQTRFVNPSFNFLNLQEAVVYFKPISLFQVEAGAVNQEKVYDNRMFIAERSFPGIFVKSVYDNKNYRIGARVQYAIPTSTSFETDRIEEEALPNLTSVGLEAKWIPYSWLRFAATLDQFKYSDLPTVVAFQSFRFGNSVLGQDRSASQYQYEFEGLNQVFKAEWDYAPKYEQSLTIASVVNSKAPSDRSRSQWFGTSFTFKSKSYDIKPEFALFYAESDSTPSIYSAWDYGRNNRDGQYAGLTIDFKEMGFKLKADYISAEKIENHPLQSDVKIFDLYLEFDNVVL